MPQGLLLISNGSFDNIQKWFYNNLHQNITLNITRFTMPVVHHISPQKPQNK